MFLWVMLLCCPQTASACSFCSAPARTLSDDLKDATAAVMARLESISDETEGIRKCRMRVIEVIKGDPDLQNAVVDTVFYQGASESAGELPADGVFWLVAYGEPGHLEWTSPSSVLAEGVVYFRGLHDLPADGSQRLAYFLRFLQHSDKLISDDAHSEFTKASSKDIVGLGEKFDREWVLTRLRDSQLAVNRRRLYWTFLSLCGTAEDAGLFDELVKNRSGKASYAALDAAISCFVTLGGEEALARIEHDYLTNPSAEYADTYAAIRALRIHGEELNSIPQQRLAAALRLVLQQPALADLVMPDLARWGDWSAIDRIVELFRTATEETSFLKSAAVRYLQACPLPAAAEALDTLRAIDLQAVQQTEELNLPDPMVPPLASAEPAGQPMSGSVAPVRDAGPAVGSIKRPAGLRGRADRAPSTALQSRTGTAQDGDEDAGFGGWMPRVLGALLVVVVLGALTMVRRRADG